MVENDGNLTAGRRGCLRRVFKKKFYYRLLSFMPIKITQNTKSWLNLTTGEKNEIFTSNRNNSHAHSPKTINSSLRLFVVFGIVYSYTSNVVKHATGNDTGYRIRH